MKSKLIANYNQKLNPAIIHQLLFFLEKELIEEFSQRLPIQNVVAPLYSTKQITSSIFQEIESRNITFGTATDSNIYMAFNNFNYWFRNQLLNLEIENNNGIISALDYIKRDTEDSNDSTLRKKIIHIEIRTDLEDVLFKEKEIEKILRILNKSIIQVSKKLSREFSFKNNIFSQVKEFNFIKDKLEFNNLKEVINDLTSKYGTVNFFSVNYKKIRAIQYSDEHYYAITTSWNQITKKSFSLIKSGIRKTYKEIDSLSKDTSLDPEDEIFFAKKMLKNDVPNSIYFKIDVLRILLSMTNSAHIGELIPDTQNESLEKYKKSFGIKKI